MLLDELLPHPDVSERHRRIVRAPADVAYAALRRVDLARSPTVRLLFALRGLPRLLRRGEDAPVPMNLDGFLRAGFVLLAEEPGRELVLGVVGRFWSPGGDIVRLDPGEFGGFDRPGHAKAAWSIRVQEEGEVVALVTETRVAATDAAARRRLRAYWGVIRPFSGWVRRRMLALAVADAEARALRGRDHT